MRRNRIVLKNYFGEGARPTPAQFQDLVDSSLNIVDDGFSWSPDNGIELKRVATKNRLLSLFHRQAETPDWAITCNDAKSLNFSLVGGPLSATPNSNQTQNDDLDVLTFNKDGKVGIGVHDPQHELDVAGTVRSAGRFGVYGSVPADGHWHTIASVLDGCCAFEVVAGVGLAGEKKGRYALLHAVALNTFNPTGWFFNFLQWKNRIRTTHACYLSRADRLKLRWSQAPNSASHAYGLDLKAERSYGEEINIQYSITELWFDRFMENCKRRA